MSGPDETDAACEGFPLEAFEIVLSPRNATRDAATGLPLGKEMIVSPGSGEVRLFLTDRDGRIFAGFVMGWHEAMHLATRITASAAVACATANDGRPH